MPTYGTGMLPQMPQPGPPQGQGAPNPHLDLLADAMSKLDPAVIQQILGSLNAPTPVAPTPPAFQGLSPLKAAAAAMNPQFAPTLINQQMAPEQARFQQQQAAFQQAMQDKQQGLSTAGGLVGAGLRDRSYLDMLRQAETERHNRASEQNTADRIGKPPAPGYQIVYDLQGNAFWAPKPGPGAPAGTAQPVLLPGGGQATKPATEKESESAAAITVFRTTMDQLKEIIHRRIVPNTGASRGIQTIGSHIPGTEGLASMADVNIYNARRNDLGTLARTLYNATGIRAYQEVIRLINNIPPFNASPELAQTAMQQIDEAFSKAEAERQRLRPQVFGSTPGNKGSLDDEFDTYLNQRGGNAPNR